MARHVRTMTEQLEDGSDQPADAPPGEAWFAGFVAHSPFAQLVGLRLAQIGPDHVELVMPYDPKLATVGDVVHGGAIGTLIDVAATGAAWSAAPFDGDQPRAATIGYTVDLLRPATASDLHAIARVTRRGRLICHCEVDVTDDRERLVAKGLVLYRIG
jgi:uncharacterized protein (TIGR00369 family)